MDGIILTNASAIDRNSTDFYPTPENVTTALSDYLKISGMTIWEPACGEGHMARSLEKSGAIVIATELNYQNYGLGGIDFLNSDYVECDAIITNPPFKYAEEFINKCIDFKKPFALLLKSQYWHSSKRKKLFDKHKPVAILPLTWRPDFHFGTKGGSPTMEVLWTVWDKEPAQNCIYQPLSRPI